MRSQRHQRMQELTKAGMLSGWSLIWSPPVIQAGPAHPSCLLRVHIHLQSNSFMTKCQE